MRKGPAARAQNPGRGNAVMANRADDFRTYAMLAKPVSSACNLRCEYCYYCGKNKALEIVNASRVVDDLVNSINQELDMQGNQPVIKIKPNTKS